MDIIRHIKDGWRGVEYTIPQNVGNIDKLTNEELVQYKDIIFISKFKIIVEFWRRTGILKTNKIEGLMKYITEDECLILLNGMSFISSIILIRSIEYGWNRVVIHILNHTAISYTLSKRYYYYCNMLLPTCNLIQLSDGVIRPICTKYIRQRVSIEEYMKNSRYRHGSYVHHLLYLIATNAKHIRPKCDRYRFTIHILDWIAHEYPTSVQKLYDMGDDGIKFICIKYLSHYIDSSIVARHYKYYTRIPIDRSYMADITISCC